MKILLHDYAGHPFQAELSRKLASRGHTVIHAYFGADLGPKGRMQREAGDPDCLQFEAVDPGTDYSKTNFIKRRAGDLAYGKAVARLIGAEKPDVVISGNTPTEAQQAIVEACRKAPCSFIYWCQDFYSIAASRLLEKRLPGPGHLVGAWYRRLDAQQMRAADHVILITDAFRAQTHAWGIEDHRVSVIANWGAIDEIPVRPKDNDWAREQGLTGKRVALYTGTLAMKHDPGLLVALAEADLAETVVVAAGVGVAALEEAKAKRGLAKLRLLGLQPFERFADVLASADVLLAVIEEEAGEFSVPSKVLSYLCAGRPIVLSAPADNLAARIIVEAGAGRVVEPRDYDGFVSAVRDLLTDPVAAERAGRAGRAYAQANFDLDTVADRFEQVIEKAL